MKTTPFALIVLAGMAALGSARVPLRPVPAAHARVDLIADTTTLPLDGRTFHLGLHLRLDDGWHIYWRNPGGSGSPPTVTWSGAPAVTFGDWLWPTPARLDVAGATIYGYANDVLLMVQGRTAPAATKGRAAPPPASLTITARLSYVICSNICVNESASPTITLATGPAAVPSPQAADFTRALGALPTPFPRDWTAAATLGADTLTLDVGLGLIQAARSATFFPYERGLIDDAAPQTIEPRAGGLILHLAKSPYFLRAPPTLEGVLVLADGRAFTVNARWR